MSTHNFDTFSYTPAELSESMTTTVHDTLHYLFRQDYITEEEYENLTNTLAVYAMPNRKGFGKRLLERFFGESTSESLWVFPIVSIDTSYNNIDSNKPNAKPDLTVVDGNFGKNKDEQ